jgi:hypothetical protein
MRAETSLGKAPALGGETFPSTPWVTVACGEGSREFGRPRSLPSPIVRRAQVTVSLANAAAERRALPVKSKKYFDPVDTTDQTPLFFSL